MIQRAREVYAHGANDMAKGAARPMRSHAICAALTSPNIAGWVGRVKSLSTNGDGKGVLTVEIGTDIQLGTWNNSLSDMSDKTLIDPASQLFKVASAFKESQLVRFSGTTFSSTVDCIKEASLTLEGSIAGPDFIIRFQSVIPVE